MKYGNWWHFSEEEQEHKKKCASQKKKGQKIYSFYSHLEQLFLKQYSQLALKAFHEYLGYFCCSTSYSHVEHTVNSLLGIRSKKDECTVHQEKTIT